MTLKDIREKKIISIKKSLAKKYIYFMTAIIASYSTIFGFCLKDESLFYYTAFGSVFLLAGWSFLCDKVNLNKLVAHYLLLAPVYNFYIVIRFWELSVASFVWFIPIPFGAYIFFKKKVVIFYIIYAIVVIIISFLLAYMIKIRFSMDVLPKMRFFDTSIIIINFLVVSFLVYHKNKIAELEIINEIEEKQKINLPISLEDKDFQMFEKLFLDIDTYVFENANFKDSNLTISTLSNYLNVNSTYISKAIRLKHFQNFNHYINVYRINYAKSLLDSIDMNKVTLLYIYTESGFKSQTTFNRVFKQIEGLTPSEYIKN